MHDLIAYAENVHLFDQIVIEQGMLVLGMLILAIFLLTAGRSRGRSALLPRDAQLVHDPEYSTKSESHSRRDKILLYLNNSEASRPFSEFHNESHSDRGDFEFTRFERAWHRALLRWQLDNDEYLLLERVTELVAMMPISDEIISIGLKAEPGRVLARDVTWYSPRSLFSDFFRFRWRRQRYVSCVFMEVASSEYRFYEAFRELKFEPGIRVYALEVKRPQHVLFSASGAACLEGVIGGAVRDINLIYGVTCRHAICRSCNCMRFGQQEQTVRSSSYDSPLIDVALVSPPRGLTVSEIDTAKEQQELSAFRAEEVLTHTPGPSHRRRWMMPTFTGSICSSPISIMRLHNFVMRGPLIQVRPRYKTIAGIVWPPGKAYFSTPGHSGSWVTDRAKRTWYGMVVGGADPPSNGYILVARVIEMMIQELAGDSGNQRPSAILDGPWLVAK